MRYYKTLTNAMARAKENEAVVKFVGFDDNDTKRYRVMHMDLFFEDFSTNQLYHLITIK